MREYRSCAHVLVEVAFQYIFVCLCFLFHVLLNNKKNVAFLQYIVNDKNFCEGFSIA